MTAQITKTKINYNGKQVSADKIKVASIIPIDIDSVWEKVQTSALLSFVSKGSVSFIPTSDSIPETWKEGITVSVKMKIYGFVPIAGPHYIYFEKIDPINKILQTIEWDHFAKMWNHKISMQKINENSIIYEDEVIIYGGILTCLISRWAKLFYKHRQKRWLLLANGG
jgi:hypothetical protein